MAQSPGAGFGNRTPAGNCILTILYLVRHGKTDYSGHRISGYLPWIHLNEEGRLQAAKAADFLARFPIQYIYASPMERTMETAAIIAGRHALPIVQVDFLKEINFGDFQGKGQELLQNPTWQAFHSTPSQVRFPAGESVQEAQRRVVQGLDDLARTHTSAEEIVCVAHCEILRLVLAHALAMPLDAFMRLTIDTASVSKVEWDPARQRILLLNYSP